MSRKTESGKWGVVARNFGFRRNPVKKIRSKQQGFALLLFVTVLATAATTLTVKALNNNGNVQIDRDKITAAALAQAKDALIGYASTYRDTHSNLPLNGYLPNPDLGPGFNFPEGSAAGSSSRDISMIGKLPWRELGLSPLSNGNVDCLWYIVAGRFKNQTKTDSLNWDTLGQIDVIDVNDNPVASNLAALIIAPGKPLDGQTRTLVDANHTRCGGNYDARNYLDAYAYNTSDALYGQFNYFTGSTNNSRAPDTNNKIFVQASNDHYNDQLLFVTADDLFRKIINRNDFPLEIQIFMNDSDLIHEVSTITISTANKGTSNLNCGHITDNDNQNFCNNWKEMLLLTKLPAPESITIDGAATASCNRVLIFGGQKTANQVRLTSANKTDPANYLEGSNLTAFALATANNNSFTGTSTFSASSPSADLLRCIP